ncbi:MAG: hypothetical protein FH756_18540 [Firmicutes bacterium]|nr:hypothetical protein [Bacillota bacterium]
MLVIVKGVALHGLEGHIIQVKLMCRMDCLPARMPDHIPETHLRVIEKRQPNHINGDLVAVFIYDVFL